MNNVHNYECVIITRPDLAENLVTQLKEKLSATITEMKGTLTSLDDWGKRKLAYIIKKEIKGHYYLVKFQSENGAIINEIERTLRINENVLRYLTVKLIQNRKSPAARLKQESATVTPTVTAAATVVTAPAAQS